MVQKATLYTTRMLSLCHKFDHITPVLKDLHWLPVEQIIEYTYKALHGKAPAYTISPSCCLCILQPGPCDQRPKISPEYQDAVWKGLVDAALCMPLHSFGTLSLHLLNVRLPLMPSRAVWRLIYSMWHIRRSLTLILYKYIVCDSFSVFYLQALLSTHSDFSPFFKLALYKYNIIIIIILLLLLLYYHYYYHYYYCCCYCCCCC